MMKLPILSLLISRGAPLPKKFEFDEKLYHIGASSDRNLASVFSGEIPLGYVGYYSESDKITIWFGLLSEGSYKAFFVAKGDEFDTINDAKRVYESLKERGLVTGKKTYVVPVVFKGQKSFRIHADTPDEAERLAMKAFEDEEPIEYGNEWFISTGPPCEVDG